MRPRTAAMLRAALLLLVTLAVLGAAAARGLPEPRDGAVPDWSAADTTTAH